MILVTGGCGYLGSHFLLRLLLRKKNVVCLDNLTNSSENILLTIEKLAKKKPIFVKGNVGDEKLVLEIFEKYNINSVVHFAGYKSIIDSIDKPFEYFNNNIVETISLLNAMNKADVRKLIFSSSATVYGNKHPLPWHEDLKLELPENPYAQSKLFIEQFLESICINTNNLWNIGVLRYFNPIGCHSSGKIGESITSNSSNLIPAILDVILNKKKLMIYGGDYDTYDGTAIRDYIHVEDLISGHESALNYIDNKKGYYVWNLGSGKGYSVLEVVKEFEKVFDLNIPYKIVNRRKGDIDNYYADISKVKKDLNWNTQFELSHMVEDILRQVKKMN